MPARQRCSTAASAAASMTLIITGVASTPTRPLPTRAQCAQCRPANPLIPSVRLSNSTGPPFQDPEPTVPSRAARLRLSRPSGGRPNIDLDLEPARVAKVSRVSNENLLIFPCSRSLRRGWVMPSRRAARACVVFQARTFRDGDHDVDRIVIVAASSGLSSSASHTLAKFELSLTLSSFEFPQSCDGQRPGRVARSFVTSSGTRAAHGSRRQGRDIDDTVSCDCIADSDLASTGTDRWHRLPIARSRPFAPGTDRGRPRGVHPRENCAIGRANLREMSPRLNAIRALYQY